MKTRPRMDRYFKSHFWSFRLCVLALAGFFFAQTVSAIVGWQFARPASALAAARPSALPPPSPRAHATSAFLERNVFHAMRTDRTLPPRPVGGVLTGGKIDKSGCLPAATPGHLVTTFVASVPDVSVAVFRGPSALDLRVVRVGAVVHDGAILAAVERGAAWVVSGDRCERYTLHKPDTLDASAGGRRQGGSGHDASDIMNVGPGEYTLSRATVDALLTRLDKVATEVRIVPSFRNGKANGFKLISIRPNSVFAQVGLKNGDVVQKINGHAMNSPQAALAVYEKVKSASSIAVDLVRRGKLISVSIAIR